MWRKKHAMLGLVIFTVVILVLSGCGGGSNNGGGGDDDLDTFDLNPESFEDTTWKCTGSGARPEITVAISDILESQTDIGTTTYTGSVNCATTGTITVAATDPANNIWLMGLKFGETEIISFHVYATNTERDVIQIDGTIGLISNNEIMVDYLLIDYDDETDHSDYEYDSETSSETVIFTRV